MNIGFDLDGIFIDKPPIIPKWLIEMLYKEKDTTSLHYRIPGFWEQKVRKLSHIPFLRPPIKKNLEKLTIIAHQEKSSLFIISSRFNFLQHETQRIVEKYGFHKIFKKTFFNSGDEQPHLFKNRLLQEQKIDIFVDDDLALLSFLAIENPKIIFYWLNPKKTMKIKNNLFAITDLLHIIK